MRCVRRCCSFSVDLRTQQSDLSLCGQIGREACKEASENVARMSAMSQKPAVRRVRQGGG